MHVANVGRNEPCPCGSGRKYKRCCLDAREGAIAGTSSDLDVKALVDHAIETDDWSVLHELVDRAMGMFAIGDVLGHVRFREDQLDVSGANDLESLCRGGWVARCELEITQVLAQVELEREDRDALRMALHLVRRFGIKSPIVEEVLKLQIDECVGRRRRLANAMADRGLSPRDVERSRHEVRSWLERVRPPILSFAEWFALRAAPESSLETIWRSCLSQSVFETCLGRLEGAPLEETATWAALAELVMFGELMMGRYLAHATPLRAPTADEQIVHDTIDGSLPEGAEGILRRIVQATDARSDLAGGALLRETIRLLRLERRGL